MASSKLLEKSESPSLIILSPRSFSRFFSHLLHWPWGSMLSENLLAFFMMIAFSILNESEGNPFKVQSLILTGSPKTFYNWKLFEEGIWWSLHCLIHCWMIMVLKAAVKAPKYAIIPDATRTSPVRFTYCLAKIYENSAHLPFSPPRELISFSALSSCCDTIKNSCSSLCRLI